MTRSLTARAVPVLAVAVALSPLAAAAAATASAAPARGSVYVIQGVDATTMALSIDGRQIARSAAAKAIIGPLALSAGSHTVTARPAKGGTAVTATMTVKSGASVDAIVHRQVDPQAKPVFTTYVNDLSKVSAGSGRLVVAHTAAVGPADVRVKGKVLFSNIANGESLTLTVPKGKYPVDIVPTATNGPTVFGPVDLPVTAEALTRVFAIGVAATKSMDAVVQVLPIGARGSGSTPSGINAGDGGQAQAAIAEQDPSSLTGAAGHDGLGLPAAGAGLLGAGVVLAAARRRRLARRSSHR